MFKPAQAHSFSIKYIVIHSSQLQINVFGDLESFPSIITEWECDEYIRFSHKLMSNSMGKLGA